MPYKDGEWYAVTLAPKGEGKKKKKNDKPSKTVPHGATADSNVLDELKETVTERNNRNRGFGKSVERNVANLLGGERVPASGAIKTSNWNLLGDVQVKYEDGKQVLAVVECKGTSGITP